MGTGKEAVEALPLVRKEFGDTDEAGFYKSVLGKVRNLAAFHYKEETFRQGLEKLAANAAEASLVIAESAGFNRYSIADAVLDGRVVEAAGGTPNGVDDALGRAVDLSRALDRVVSDLGSALIQSRPGAVEVGPEESIAIPPALNDARARLDGKKGGQTSSPTRVSHP